MPNKDVIGISKAVSRETFSSSSAGLFKRIIAPLRFVAMTPSVIYAITEESFLPFRHGLGIFKLSRQMVERRCELTDFIMPVFPHLSGEIPFASSIACFRISDSGWVMVRAKYTEKYRQNKG